MTINKALGGYMVLVIFMYALFASTFTLGKAALSYVSPFLFIGMRMILGGSLLLTYHRLVKKRKNCNTQS